MNIQGMHNLCVVYVERGKLRQALECLQRAHKLAPGESYILKHLNIVKQRIIDLSQAAAMQKQKNDAQNDNSDDSETDESDGNDLETRFDVDENNATTNDNNIESNEMHAEDINNSEIDGRTLSTTKNQKHPGDSTISEATNSINPNGIRRCDDPPKKIQIDAIDAETESQGHTNRRPETHKISQERTSTTHFGHDLDEPSSGTS